MLIHIRVSGLYVYFVVVFCFNFFFFFSSRRRHTRYIGDWSSDVCSSDLKMRGFFDPKRYRIVLFDQRGCGKSRPNANRSEERRVGKECRSRWSRENEKKKKTEREAAQTRERAANTAL